MCSVCGEFMIRSNMAKKMLTNFSLCFVFINSTGYRTIEKGRGAMGSQIEMEKYSGGLWTFLNRMVFAVHAAADQIKIR